MIQIRLLDQSLIWLDESEVGPGLGLVWVNVGSYICPIMELGIRV